MDGMESMDLKGCTDDENDDTIVSIAFGHRFVLDGISKLNKINSMKLLVALKDNLNSKVFKFAFTWIIQRIIFRFSAGTLTLVIVTFLLLDNQRIAEVVLIGFSIPQKLGIDT